MIDKASDSGLVIVPAGAGAGKTHRIQTQLSDWVKRKIVRPDRILAVTFTEAAAGELRERIRAALLKDGLVEEAMAVERAYVSTIHGLGLRLITEHSLAAGASLQPRHLADAERDLLVRQALAHSISLDPIKNEPARFGYKPNWQNGETVEVALRTRVLAIIDLLRGLGEKGHDPGLITPALDRLDTIYGATLAAPDVAQNALQTAVSAMLTAFPEGGMKSVVARGPRAALEEDFRLFRRVNEEPTLLRRNWGTWQSLRKLRVSNRSSKTPEGYDDLAAAIIEAADALPAHPGPLADAKQHLSCLIACAQEIMEAYETQKKALGLIDYADMIAGAERLLRTDPAVLKAVLGEIDCVIIDEFQDTNPVQFALLWQLGANAPRTLLVGDVKQSIMGFQGADPRLSQALAVANPESIQPLVKNWRSTPAIMEFVNALGGGLFGAGYTPLSPDRASMPGPAVEIVKISHGRRARNYSKPQEHIAERITRILNARQQVVDRQNKQARDVRPSDIALLVCRHSTAGNYAEALRSRGVPVRIAEDGWAKSAVVSAARAALSYAANPSDAHSGLLLRTLGPDPMPLQDALAAQMDDRLADDQVLMTLASLSDQISRLPIKAALDLVLEATDLRLWAICQPDGAQARADLLRLEAEADAFEAAHRDLKAASGFHGETAKVFLGWLDARASERDFDRRPDPSANSADAVEIVTWHASKGREWPITVVAEFDREIEERPWTTGTQFTALENLDDMNAVLSSATLVHTPGFSAPEVKKRFVEDRRSDFEANAKNLLYVALTRARDRVVLEWPEFLKDRADDAPEAKCLFHILEDCCAPQVSAESLRISGTDCPAHITSAPEIAGVSDYAGNTESERVLFGKQEPLIAKPLTPWRLQPSQMMSQETAPDSRRINIGAPWTQTVSNADRGTAIHLAMRTFLTRPDLSSGLATATDLDPEVLEQLANRSDALKAWLSSQGYKELLCEIPVIGFSSEGAEMPGTIDLLAIGGSGSFLIDHKTGGTGEGFGPYWPQLTSYAGILAQLFPEHPLQGMGIFWVDHGNLEMAEPHLSDIPLTPAPSFSV